MKCVTFEKNFTNAITFIFFIIQTMFQLQCDIPKTQIKFYIWGDKIDIINLQLKEPMLLKSLIDMFCSRNNLFQNWLIIGFILCQHALGPSHTEGLPILFYQNSNNLCDNQLKAKNALSQLEVNSL